MGDDIEVKITDKDDAQPEDKTPVSFEEDANETLVTVGEEKKSSEPSRDDERLRAAEQDNLRLRADFADMRARLAGQPSSQAPSQGSDPWRAQEEAISEQERALGIQWEAHKAARSLSPELLKEFDQKSRDLQQQRINIATTRAIQGSLPSLLQATQEQHYAREYADVRSNPQANRWARGYYDQLIARGAPDSAQTVHQAMTAARMEFRLPGYRMSPTDQDRQQLTGFGGTSRRSAGPKDNVVKMGKAEKGMAMAMYGDRFNGDERKAYAAWAKGPGIRALKAYQKAGRRA